MKAAPFFPLALIVGLIILCSLPGAAQAACAAPVGTAGAIGYNATAKAFQYCNGTNWVRMTKPGSGSGGCTNPTLAEGKLGYNQDFRTLQGCAGNVQRTAGVVGGANQWASVNAGGSHACGILDSGKLFCWGGNGLGRLGDNTTTDRAVPTPVSGGGVWKQVSAGNHSCAIKSDDTIWCWGFNFYGQLGDNSTTSKYIPTAINGGGTWKQVSAGSVHTCAIKSDDTLWCWGQNTNGRTGRNTSVGNTLVPSTVTGGGAWKKVSAGNAHTCGIKSDDTLWCWGLNTNGRLGDNTQTQRLIPTAVNGGGAWKNVSAGNAHTCGIKSDDTIRCWGLNTNGRIGDNTTTQRLIPTAISGGGTWKHVTAGSSNTCAIKSDDTMRCWGANGSGQVGDGTLIGRLIPTALAGGGTWAVVDTEGSLVCAITLGDGTMKCWGNGGNGQRGDNTNEVMAGTPALVAGDEDWLDISAGSLGWGNNFTCGVKAADGSVWCWGYNDYGVLGPTVALGGGLSPPVKVSGAHVFTKVTAGAYHACALKADGSAWCWGGNDEGMLGDGTNIDKNAPVAVSGGHVFTKLIAKAYHTCGLKADGSAWCWGANWDYQLGDGTNVSKNIPTAVSGGHQWKDIGPGNTGTCGVRIDGVGMCWGDYAIGNGTWNSPVPAVISGGYTWKTISYGSWQACGVRTDDVAMCWGSDWSGELGNGAADWSDHNTPVSVTGGHAFKSIFAGNEYTCGIRIDDTAMCWGENYYGQGGNGTVATTTDDPTSIAGGGLWEKIDPSYWHTCGILKSGKAYCWGYYFYGALGDGKIGMSVTPGQTMCGTPAGKPGTLVYNSDFNVLQYCDGAGWVKIRQ